MDSIAAVKVAVFPTGFTVNNGTEVVVKFNNVNTAVAPTLTVQTGATVVHAASPIYYDGNALTSNKGVIYAGINYVKRLSFSCPITGNDEWYVDRWELIGRHDYATREKKKKMVLLNFANACRYR